MMVVKRRVLGLLDAWVCWVGVKGGAARWGQRPEAEAPGREGDLCLA